MLAAKWDNTNAPPSYWAAQLRKVRNASPWVFAIALLPTGLYLFQLLIGHKATLTPLPFVFLTMIPMFIREIPRKLALPEKLESIFVRHYNDAIPCDITITNDGESLGDDEGVLNVEGDALIFRGTRCEFVLYNDMIETSPEDSDSPELSTISLLHATEAIKVRFRQRSFDGFSSESNRLHRVLKDWREGGAVRLIEACLPPVEPTPEARFSITSATAWTCIAIIWFVASWILCINGMRSSSESDSLKLGIIYFITLASTVGFGWIAVYCVSKVLKRTAFYARFEDLDTIRS